MFPKNTPLTRELARQWREHLAKYPRRKTECARRGELVEVRNDTYPDHELAEHGPRHTPCRRSGMPLSDNERLIKRRTKGSR